MSYAHYTTTLLSSGIPVLNYVGDADIVCNHLGNLAWMNNLDWPSRERFAEEPLQDFEVEGKVVGSWKSVDGLSFVRVSGAGHMVPLDQPEASLGLFNAFIGGWFEEQARGRRKEGGREDL